MDRSTDSRLSRLAQRLALWRNRRERGTRIPDEFWQEAVALAEERGVSKVATTLRLDYYSLQGRLPSAVAPPAGFVELMGASLLGGASSEGGTVIEVRAADGAQLTLRLPNSTSLDVVALVHAFRASRS
jgi:anti-sigma factor RsiW